MSDDLSSGKGHRDENFPVASRLIAARHRPAVMAFYAVARMADDIADHATATPEDKLARLNVIEESLTGRSQAVPAAVHLRDVMTEHGLSGRHILDLLEAFRRDARQTRYASWADLMDYCRYSAAPVGRYVLEVHGEDRATWPASDDLCAALQVINHLQDCGADFRQLNRVYIPLDALDAAGAAVSDLGAPQASPALRGLVSRLATRTVGLLAASRPLAGQVRSTRLALEIGVIQRIAEDLAGRLRRLDPLSERVHHRPLEAAGLAVAGAASALTRRLRARRNRAAPLVPANRARDSEI
ncbi:MAG TPA: squalene synthase HpnC [Caulobacteraceae bacterium]|jgi:squalene synthase HpnC